MTRQAAELAQDEKSSAAADMPLNPLDLPQSHRPQSAPSAQTSARSPTPASEAPPAPAPYAAAGRQPPGGAEEPWRWSGRMHGNGGCGRHSPPRNGRRRSGSESRAFSACNSCRTHRTSVRSGVTATSSLGLPREWRVRSGGGGPGAAGAGERTGLQPLGGGGPASGGVCPSGPTHRGVAHHRRSDRGGARRVPDAG